ncbi:MAG TPA: hypothetical protein VGI50_04745 [Solirubrobacteraceae bacterium]
MTTARALLRRFLRQGRLDPAVPTKAPQAPAAGQRLDEARQRLKQTIPPPEEPPASAGTAIPPREEGVSPEEESPPVP